MGKLPDVVDLSDDEPPAKRARGEAASSSTLPPVVALSDDEPCSAAKKRRQRGSAAEARAAPNLQGEACNQNPARAFRDAELLVCKWRMHAEPVRQGRGTSGAASSHQTAREKRCRRIGAPLRCHVQDLHFASCGSPWPVGVLS